MKIFAQMKKALALSKIMLTHETLEERMEALEKRQIEFERRIDDDLSLSRKTLILGACDIDQVVNVIEKRLNARWMK